MAFVARRPLRLTGPDGKSYAVLPGEQVPGFAEWSYAIRQAHLSQETVVDTTPGKRYLSTVGGRLHLQVYGEVKDAPAPPVEVPEEAFEPAVVDVADEMVHACAHCAHPGFANKNSLAKHIKRKHPEA